MLDLGVPLTIQVCHSKNGKFGTTSQTAMLQTLHDHFQDPTLSHDKTPDYGRRGNINNFGCLDCK